ncbi:hypothetical protein JGK42_000093 [Aeromonas veronii]|nr:hypothetical protein [Aeromonas veronii]
MELGIDGMERQTAAPLISTKEQQIAHLAKVIQHNDLACILSKFKENAMATALGCSPQFAVFNHIALAVGHRVLQHG